MTIADLKAAIHSDTNVPPPYQRLFHEGRELRDDTKTLRECGIAEDNVLGMLVLNSAPVAPAGPPPSHSPARGHPPPAARGPPRRASEPDPEMIRLQALGNPRILAQIRATNPDLAGAVTDPRRFRDVWQTMQRRMEEIEEEKQRELALLNADPFNPDAQRKIEETIRQERVMENLQDAMDHTPEGENDHSPPPNFP